VLAILLSLRGIPMTDQASGEAASQT